MALSPDQWKAVRHCWEYDPDKPSYQAAADRAAAKFGFTAPKKQSVAQRAKDEGWERLGGSMASVAAAAQRKADAFPDGADGAPDGQADESGGKKGPADAAAHASSLEDATDKRAAVLARHRQEWVQVAQLRQEALVKRPHKNAAGLMINGNVKEAFEAAKLAKITAEMTLIQQTGERKAWGLDIVVDPDQMRNLSDEDLRAIAEGRAPRRT